MIQPDLLKAWSRLLSLICLSREGAVTLLVFASFIPSSGVAAPLPDPILLVSASVPSSLPAGLLLQWPRDTNALSYIVYRAPYVLGMNSNVNWIWLAEVSGDSTQYLDSEARGGQAYEYAVEKNFAVRAELKTARTVISAGREIPLVDQRGRVILLVDNTHSTALASELGQLTQDLAGEGWLVSRHDVSPQETPARIWRLIKNDYDADPLEVRAVFLLGRIPRFILTVTNAPGSHDKISTWADDSVYGVMNSALLNEHDELRNNQLPIELAVGRVDLSEMPAFAPLSETDLLRRYLLKNHQFRHNLLTLSRRAMIDDRFGGNPGPATMSWKLFSALFGPAQVSAQECVPTLSSQGYLWLAAGGYSSPMDAGSAITTVHFRDANPHVGFALLYGSLLGNWIYPDDILRAVLASPQYGLASLYGLQLDPCFLYRMALGESLGECNRAQQQASSNRFCVNLMGDPTLRLHPVTPPANLLAVLSGSGVQLSWTASVGPEVAGYHVYRSDLVTGPFERLTTIPVMETSFLDQEFTQGRCSYLVRSVKLETSAGGTYWNASPGLFVTIEKPSSEPVLSISALVPRLRSNSTNTALFRLLLSRPADQPFPLRYQLGGTAQAGIDYVLADTNIVVAEGSLEAWMALKTISTSETEPMESRGKTAIITLLPDPDYRVGPSAQSVLVIEPEEEVNVAATFATVTAGSNKRGEFTLTRSGPANNSATINYSLSGTALPGEDYEDLARTVVMPQGVTSIILPVAALDLSTQWPAEGRKTLILNLQEGRGYRLGAHRAAAVSILKNEPLPMVEIKASIPVAQEAGLVPGEFTFARTGNLNRNLTIYLLSPSGTATPAHYSVGLNLLFRVPVVIPYGKASVALPIVPVNNRTLDFDRTLTFSLAPDPSYAIGDSKSATVTIQDRNDPEDTPEISISIKTTNSVVYAQSSSNIVLEIMRSGGTNDFPVSLRFEGTATNGIHYELLPETFTIPAGSQSARLFVRPIPNDRGEGLKTITVSLAPSPRYQTGAESRAYARIYDVAYHVWRTRTFGSDATDPTVVGRDADPDGDGYCNYLEYLFDIDPQQRDRIGPKSMWSFQSGRYFYTYIICQYSGCDEFEAEVEYSTDLTTPGWAKPEDPLDRKFVRSSPLGSWGAQYIRLINAFTIHPEMGPHLFLRIRFILKE